MHSAVTDPCSNISCSHGSNCHASRMESLDFTDLGINSNLTKDSFGKQQNPFYLIFGSSVEV